MKQLFAIIFLLILGNNCYSQIQEINPPFHIKSAHFTQVGHVNVPIFPLGESFSFVFDDLYGNEANYYYSIIHCDYDWKKSDLAITEYIDGFDNQRITQYENSFNTLQMYSHYQLTFPNNATRAFKASGNYILQILNNDQEIILSRRFILYEDRLPVAVQIKKPRQIASIQTKHNVEFTINTNQQNIQDPVKNLKILLFQNGQFNRGIRNIKPMYTLGHELIYRYDKETQFWAGNEFLNFDNKDIRVAANFVQRVDASTEIYSTHLFVNTPRANSGYTFFPDINGGYLPRNIMTDANANAVADYSWVYFYLDAPAYFGKSDIYVTGMFNNYAMTGENKLVFNKDSGLYECAILLKQGFTNYQYTLADQKGTIDYENALDGNFVQTENQYDLLVYYRSNSDRYDRVIGKGSANSQNIIN